MSSLLWTTKETSSGKRTARNESFGTTVHSAWCKSLSPIQFFSSQWMDTECSKKTWAILCRKARKTIWHSTATARYKDLIVLNKCYSKLKANPNTPGRFPWSATPHVTIEIKTQALPFSNTKVNFQVAEYMDMPKKQVHSRTFEQIHLCKKKLEKSSSMKAEKTYMISWTKELTSTTCLEIWIKFRT